MINFSAFLSFFGISLGITLAFILFITKKQNALNKWLAGLLAFSSIIISIISLSHFFGTDLSFYFTVGEKGLTFLFGPFVYLFSLRFLGRSFPSAKKMILHFIPFAGYLMSFIVANQFGHSLLLPIIIPVLHFQLYTLWLILTLVKEGILKTTHKKSKSEEWLFITGIMLTLIHIAQWIRYIFNEVPLFEQLIPIIAFIAFYLLTLFGLFRSNFIIAQRNQQSLVSESLREDYKRQLVQLFETEEIHKNPDLSLQLLGDKLGVSPQVLSQVINNSFDLNFNEFINKYRIDSFKRYLKDSTNDHYTIEALAQKAGFNSRSTFYLAFKKITGVSPSSYRKR